jgi:hypothetical protein
LELPSPTGEFWRLSSNDTFCLTPSISTNHIITWVTLYHNSSGVTGSPCWWSWTFLYTNLSLHMHWEAVTMQLTHPHTLLAHSRHEYVAK